ncbi:hypothetical protein Tco_1208764, partial [Tanacetum coccineum]
MLARVSTPRSGEDSLQLKELMAFCTKLQQRVLDLENIKTAQAHEITSLKRRVKKLERKKKSRTHGLKRLYKVGLSARIDSLDDEASLGDQEDASKQGRKIHDLDGNEVFVETKDPVVNVATTTKLKSAKAKAVTIAATTTTTDVTRPKAKGLVIQEQEQASTSITSSKDKGKGIMVEEPLKMKKKDQVLFDEQEAIGLQAQFNEEERIAREKEEVNTALIAQCNDIQDKKPKDLKTKSFANVQELFDKAMKMVNTFVDMDTKLVGGSKVREEGSKTREESSSKRAGDELEQEPSKKQKMEDDKET